MKNSFYRAGDLSREAILSSIREQDLTFLKEETNMGLFNDKKFCKECISTCVMETRYKRIYYIISTRRILNFEYFI